MPFFNPQFVPLPPQGRYYGELCQKVFQRDMRKRPYIATEYKVPIFGMNGGEWGELARWIRATPLLGFTGCFPPPQTTRPQLDFSRAAMVLLRRTA